MQCSWCGKEGAEVKRIDASLNEKDGVHWFHPECWDEHIEFMKKMLAGPKKLHLSAFSS